MTTYRLWPSTNGPATSVVDTTYYSMGVEFEITGAGGVTAFYWWVAADGNGSSLTSGLYDFTLYQVTSATTGTVVAGTQVNGVTGLTAGQWNRVALPAGVVLTPGVRYRAVVHSATDHFYSATAYYWSSGMGSTGITNGILSAPNATNATGALQGSFLDWAKGFPNQSYNSANYWIDVEIDNTVGGVNYTGTATRTGTGTLTAAGIVDSQASITQVGTATTYQTTTSTSSTIINVPTGVVAGDLLWLTVSNQAVDVIATPTDWNLASQANATGLTAAVFWQFAPASPPASYTITTPAARHAAVMTAWRGVNSPTPFDVAAPTSTIGTDPPVLPGITTVTASAVILGVIGLSKDDGGQITVTATNSDAIVGQVFSTGTGINNTNVGTTVVVERIGTVGSFTPTITPNTTSTRYLGQTFALRPAVVGVLNGGALLAATGTVTTAGTVGVVTTHSFYGATAPAGSSAVGTDGTPGIVMGHTYYRTGTTTRWVTGARVYVPAGVLGTQVKLMLWHAPVATDGVRTAQYNLNTTPQQTKTVAVTPGGWVEGTFDVPVEMPNANYRVMVGYQFVDRPGDYIFWSTQYPTDQAVPFPTLTDVFVSKRDEASTTWGPVARAYYRIGTGALSNPLNDAGYGIDLLVSDGAPQVAAYEGTATITGTGSLTASWLNEYAGTSTRAGVGTITAAGTVNISSGGGGGGPTVIQQASGTFGGTGTFTATLPSPTNAANTVICVVFGNTVVTTPTGWTLRSSMVASAGHYCWDRTGDGASSWAFSAASTYALTWWIAEIPGTSTFDVAPAAITAPFYSGQSYSTPSITPTAGTRLVVASIGGLSGTSTVRTFSGWTNGFVEVADLCQPTADYPAHGVAILDDLATDGSTAHSTTATFSVDVSSQAVGGLIAAWSAASAPTEVGIAGVGTISTAGAVLGAGGSPTIAGENALTGQGRAFWLDGIGSSAMPAFARSTYYTPGQTAQFSIGYNSAFTVDIWRLGHYADNGARSVQAGIVGTPTAQPTPVAITGGNGAITCAAWSVNGSWTVPADATPGWYWAVLRGGNGTDFGHIMFCVSDVNTKKPVLLVTGDATWHAAYNGYGGNNVYGAALGLGDANARALCSTYDKPVLTMDHIPQTHFLNNTYPMLKYLESVGIEVGVTTIEQIKNDPTVLDGRDLIIWSGHNEYIPQSVMDKTKALLAAGQNMVNAAANDFFWRVKFTDGAFGSTTNGRVMWCKKDTLNGPSSGPDAVAHNAGVPFTTDADWTGTWQDTRWTLREPSSEFFGDEFIANGLRWDQVKVPFAMKVLAPWRDCPGVQALAFGGTYSFATGTLGMEWDKPKGALAAHSFSSSVVDLSNNTADVNGETYNNSAVVTHSIQMVRNGNSFIANFNSDQWAWALDALHLRGNAAADINARQMMLNVIYDLGGTANSTSVSSAGLVLPTAQDIETAYSLSASTDLSTGSALTGTGAIVTGGAVALSGDTSLVGTGTLAAAGMIDKSTEATVAGVGAAVAEGLVAGVGTGSISGVGSISTAGLMGRSSEVTHSGVGTIATTGSVVVAGGSTGDLNGIGATTTTGYVSITTTTTSVGTGTLTVDGAVEKFTTVTLAATATLTSAGDVAAAGVSGSAFLIAIATITTSSVVVQIEHEAIIAETATITVTGFVGMATGASLVGVGRVGPVPPGPRFGVWNGTTFDMLEVGEWNGTAFDMLHLLEAP